MDRIPADEVARFEKGLVEYVRTRHGSMIEAIAATGVLPEGEGLKQAIEEYVDTFLGE
jgi:F0F1-type ATP synthase alpha subunit